MTHNLIEIIRQLYDHDTDLNWKHKMKKVINSKLQEFDSPPPMDDVRVGQSNK